MEKHHSLFDDLYEGVLMLQSTDDCRRFFTDICTIKEMEALAQRFQVARLLAQGNNYNEVYEKTGVSTATICRVNKCLNYGEGGYRLVLNRLADPKEGEGNE